MFLRWCFNPALLINQKFPKSVNPFTSCCLLLLFCGQGVNAIELPHVINVGQLNCSEQEANKQCEAESIAPEIVAKAYGEECGFFKGNSGPLNNRLFDRCDPAFDREYAIVCIKGNDGRHGCGLINQGISVVIPLVYDEIRLVQDVPVVAVKYLDNWGFYSLKERRLLFTPQFSYVSDFGDGYAYVIDADADEDEPAWIIDDQGLRVAPVSQGINVRGQFANGLIPAEIDNRWGYLNSEGGWAIAPQFFDANSFHQGMAAVKYETALENWAIINTGGEGLVFFEGPAHQLEIRKDSKVVVSMGCSHSGSERGPAFAVNQRNAGERCKKMCFEPTLKALQQLCVSGKVEPNPQ